MILHTRVAREVEKVAFGDGMYPYTVQPSEDDTNTLADSDHDKMSTVTIVVCVVAAIVVMCTLLLVVCIIYSRRRVPKKKLLSGKYDRYYTAERRASPFSVALPQRQMSDPSAQRSVYNALDLVSARPQMSLDTDNYRTAKKRMSMDKLTKFYSLDHPTEDVATASPPLKKSRSMASLITSSAPAEQEQNGSISFTLKYVPKLRQLHLKLHGVSDLPIKAYGHDIYATVYLYPRNTEGVNSRCIRGGRQTTFEETFFFDDMTLAEVEKSTLRLVLNYRRRTRGYKDAFIGELFMKCHEVEWNVEQPAYFDGVLLKTRVKNGSTSSKYLFEDLGSIFVCLEYKATAGRLNVMVRKAANLPKSDKLFGRPGHKVIIQLMKNRDVVRRQDTRWQTGYNPIWNQPFLFDINDAEVNDYCLDFIIKREKIHTKDAIVGHVSIGMTGCKSGRAHWKEIMSARPTEHAQWHCISPMFNFKEDQEASNVH